MTKTIDYEDGGIAIQNPSDGLMHQRWRARLFDAGRAESRVMLSAPSVPEFEAYAAPDITEISFSFDRNMRVTLAFVQSGVAKLWWFDSMVSGMVVTAIGDGVVSPRVSHDDKRDLASAWADVILAYVRDNNLYYRQQRDRYLTERLLAEDVRPLIKIGMGRGYRMQFMYEAG